MYDSERYLAESPLCYHHIGDLTVGQCGTATLLSPCSFVVITDNVFIGIVPSPMLMKHILY